MLKEMTAPPAARTDLCRITVRGKDGSEECFDVRKNDLLLKAAVEQGIDYPHNCRVGVCGQCKTRLVSGRVSPMVDLALSPLSNEQIEAGFVLACQAKVRGDLVLDVKLGHGAQLPVRTVSARVTRYRKLPGDVVDLRLKLDEAVAFNAGQYCTIAESGSFTRRSYSYYDVPAADGSPANEVGFLIKRLPGGKFSEWLFAEDRTSVKFWIEGPRGADPVPRAGRLRLDRPAWPGHRRADAGARRRLRRQRRVHLRQPRHGRSGGTPIDRIGRAGG